MNFCNFSITGITLNGFLQGKYLDFNGNIDAQHSDIYGLIQCGDR